MEQESKGNRFLTFRLENEKYGIDILAVKFGMDEKAPGVYTAIVIAVILNLDSIVDAREIQTIQASQKAEDSIPTQEVHT